MEGFSILFILSFLVVTVVVVSFPIFVSKFTTGETDNSDKWSDEEQRESARPQKKKALITVAVLIFVVLYMASSAKFSESVIISFVIYTYGAFGLSSFFAGTPIYVPYAGTKLVRVRDRFPRLLMSVFYLAICTMGVFFLK